MADHTRVFHLNRSVNNPRTPEASNDISNAMSQWMTSGASRLRAKQNRSFSSRAQQRASVVSVAANVHAAGIPGRKHTGGRRRMIGKMMISTRFLVYRGSDEELVCESRFGSFLRRAKRASMHSVTADEPFLSSERCVCSIFMITHVMLSITESETVTSSSKPVSSSRVLSSRNGSIGSHVLHPSISHPYTEEANASFDGRVGSVMSSARRVRGASSSILLHPRQSEERDEPRRKADFTTHANAYAKSLPPLHPPRQPLETDTFKDNPFEITLRAMDDKISPGRELPMSVKARERPHFGGLFPFESSRKSHMSRLSLMKTAPTGMASRIALQQQQLPHHASSPPHEQGNLLRSPTALQTRNLTTPLFASQSDDRSNQGIARFRRKERETISRTQNQSPRHYFVSSSPNTAGAAKQFTNHTGGCFQESLEYRDVSSSAKMPWQDATRSLKRASDSSNTSFSSEDSRKQPRLDGFKGSGADTLNGFFLNDGSERENSAGLARFKTRPAKKTCLETSPLRKFAGHLPSFSLRDGIKPMSPQEKPIGFNDEHVGPRVAPLGPLGDRGQHAPPLRFFNNGVEVDINGCRIKAVGQAPKANQELKMAAKKVVPKADDAHKAAIYHEELLSPEVALAELEERQKSVWDHFTVNPDEASSSEKAKKPKARTRRKSASDASPPDSRRLEIDPTPSMLSSDPSKLASADVDDLVRDSLKEREKTLSAAGVLMDFLCRPGKAQS